MNVSNIDTFKRFKYSGLDTFKYSKIANNIFFSKTTALAQIKYGIPQGSILGQLLFLIYVNDSCNTSNIMDPIMFADDANFFYPVKILTHFIKN